MVITAVFGLELSPALDIPLKGILPGRASSNRSHSLPLLLSVKRAGSRFQLGSLMKNNLKISIVFVIGFGVAAVLLLSEFFR